MGHPPPPLAVASANEADGAAKSHTYNFKLKSHRLFMGSPCSSGRQPHKDDIIVQAIMCRADYIYISKWFSTQQPTYGREGELVHLG